MTDALSLQCQPRLSAHAVARASVLLPGMGPDEIWQEVNATGLEICAERREFRQNERKFLLYWSTRFNKALVAVVARQTGILVTFLDAWTSKAGGCIVFIEDVFGFRELSRVSWAMVVEAAQRGGINLPPIEPPITGTSEAREALAADSQSTQTRSSPGTARVEEFTHEFRLRMILPDGKVAFRRIRQQLGNAISDELLAQLIKESIAVAREIAAIDAVLVLRRKKSKPKQGALCTWVIVEGVHSGFARKT